MTILCKKQTTDILLHNYTSTFGLRANIASAIFNIGFIILYINGLIFIRTKSQNGTKIPSIFGRYQRNLMTYKLNMLLVFVQLLQQLHFPLLHIFSFNWNLDDNTITICFFFICDIIYFILLPIYIISLASKKISNFTGAWFTGCNFTGKENEESTQIKKNFYVRPPIIRPRRTFNFTETRFSQVQVKYASYHKKNIIEDLPTVVID